MTMTEPTNEIQKPKRRKTVRKAANKPAVKAPSEMDGITVSDCPSACKLERCVISGRAICAHPHKGGLQAALQTPESMRRLNEAKRILGKQKLDLT